MASLSHSPFSPIDLILRVGEESLPVLILQMQMRQAPYNTMGVLKCCQTGSAAIEAYWTARSTWIISIF